MRKKVWQFDWLVIPSYLVLLSRYARLNYLLNYRNR